MNLCSECQGLEAAPTACVAPSTFELNRLIPVQPSRSESLTYSYFTCTCGTRWVQVLRASDGAASWRILK